jgi:OOP family OmpA-OmpF porin
MRKATCLLLVTVLLLSTNLFSQKRNYIQDPTLGISFSLFDFPTAQYIEATSLRQTFRDKQFFRLKEMKPGLGISYMEGLSNHFDAMVSLAGVFLDYPMEGRPVTGTDYFLLELDASLKAKLLSNRYWLSPYLQLGAGVSKYKGYYGAYIPAGAGLQINLFDEAFILINSQYRIPVVNSTTTAHFYNSLGIAGRIGTKKKPKEPTPVPMPQIEPPSDRDSDGIVDSLDACPDKKGLAQFKGCADTDGDGIADNEDKCPDQKGVARYQGCPIPDTDGDGVNEEEDKCPTEKGVARYQGCPIPDKDKDGVNDEQDKCPDLPGVAANNGCPEIKEEVRKRVDVASQNIFFATGSYKLLAKSNKSLNDIAKLLSEDPNLKIDIEGHTDNVGKPEKNKVLSEQRAGSVLNYLKTKGVDESRLVAKGFGQEQPVADNKTAAGKAKNRRVELKLHYD